MKIKILIDTNVIIDYLADREQFADAAERVLLECFKEDVTGYVTANAITDIYYVVSKSLGKDATLDAIRTLCSVLEIVDIGKTDILGAMELDMPDYEDAIAAHCAKRINADYIITRDKTGFNNAPVKVMQPTEFNA